MMLIDAEEVQRVDEVTAETAYVLARMINAQKRMLDLADDETMSDKRAANASVAAELLDKHITELANKIESVYDAEGACTDEEHFFDVIDDYANFNFAHLDVSDDDFDYSADDDFDYLLEELDADDVESTDALDMTTHCLTFDDFI